jgi:hypothetical protein
MGTVRLDLGSRPGMGAGDVDRELTMLVRADLPCLEHRRDDVFGVLRDVPRGSLAGG